MSSAPPTDQLISIARAREIIAAEVGEPLAAEPVEVGQAIGRALAEPVRALDDVPPFANSAMDGFAVRAGDAARRLPIVGESRAGQPFARPLGEEEAVRISTGAVVPDGAEAVVPLESATEQEGWVTLHAAAPNGHNVRGAGEDMHAGE